MQASCTSNMMLHEQHDVQHHHMSNINMQTDVLCEAVWKLHLVWYCGKSSWLESSHIVKAHRYLALHSDCLESPSGVWIAQLRAVSGASLRNTLLLHVQNVSGWVTPRVGPLLFFFSPSPYYKPFCRLELHFNWNNDQNAAHNIKSPSDCWISIASCLRRAFQIVSRVGQARLNKSSDFAQNILQSTHQTHTTRSSHSLLVGSLSSCHTQHLNRTWLVTSRTKQRTLSGNMLDEIIT